MTRKLFTVSFVRFFVRRFTPASATTTSGASIPLAKGRPPRPALSGDGASVSAKTGFPSLYGAGGDQGSATWDAVAESAGRLPIGQCPAIAAAEQAYRHGARYCCLNTKEIQTNTTRTRIAGLIGMGL